MKKSALSLLRVGIGLALVIGLQTSASRADDPIDWNRELLLPRSLDFSVPSASDDSSSKPNRIRLFRMVPGFLADPLSLQDDAFADSNADVAIKPDDGPDWLQFSVGNDNPFFDWRRPGDPGGVGYTKVHSQVQIFDLNSTGFTVNMQGVTPTGVEQGGLQNGPTYISPGFSLFHNLDDGTGFQGFMGKNIRFANPNAFTGELASRNSMSQSVEYGLAVQRPLGESLSNVYLFVEALGYYRYDMSSATSSTNWEVLPGMHFKMSESWWITGGVVLPVNRGPIDAHLWQLTCSFQF